jgi:CSLREA domain-containing protein
MRGVALLSFVFSIALAEMVGAAEFVVTKTDDTFDGACDSDCSLREAVLAANSGPGHVITVPAGIYRLTRAAAPSDPEDGTTGSLFVNRPVTINGAGKDATIVDARPSDGEQGIDRVLLVGSLGAPTLTGVTLRGGRVASGSPRTFTVGTGGGVYLQRAGGSSPVSFIDCAITDNVASQSGGGISVQNVVPIGIDPDVTLLRTDVLRNRTPDDILGQGAGIWIGHAYVHVEDSTIDGNVAATTGGGVLVSVAQSQLDARFVCRRSTISDNIAGLNGSGGAPGNGGSGGGIYNIGGQIDVENCTIAFNEARPGGVLPFPTGYGGGVNNFPESGNPKTAQLVNTTVAYNVAAVGSQLYSTVFGDSNGLLLANTLIVGPPGGDPNCPTGTPSGIGTVSLGGNISSDTSLCNLKPAELGDQVGVTDSGLAEALADNGGNTPTLAIPEDSPAAGAGAAVLLCPDTDQRGVTRPLPCSVGAFEPGEVSAVACGDASDATGALVSAMTTGRAITASDALIVLSTAVGFASCPDCVCDVNGVGGITATDALIVLNAAVGQPVTLSCPACT